VLVLKYRPGMLRQRQLAGSNVVLKTGQARGGRKQEGDAA